ncbi:MAG: hypothetical protein QOH05_3433 [Acetobacteraceae bacterium]|nr:hypothetical protein [Acetobacteraceae bacterium]
MQLALSRRSLSQKSTLFVVHGEQDSVHGTIGAVAVSASRTMFTRTPLGDVTRP